MNPKVSVIIPTFNAEKFLDETVQSILAQTFTDFEVVVIDDCSSDSTQDKLKAYEMQDSRIRVILNGRNVGVAENRIRALKLAKGELIAPLDHDDVAHPDRLEQQVGFLNGNPEHGLIGSDMTIIDENSRVIGSRNYPKTNQAIHRILLRQNPIANPASMFRKDCYEKIGGYDASLCPVEDYDFVIRMAQISKLANLQGKLTRYRISAGQVKSQQLKKTIKMTLLIQRKAVKAGIKDSTYNKSYRLALHSLLLLPPQLTLKLFMALSYKKASHR